MATITTLTFRSAPGTAGDDVPWPVWLQGHSHRGHFRCGMSWASGMAAFDGAVLQDQRSLPGQTHRWI